MEQSNSSTQNYEIIESKNKIFVKIENLSRSRKWDQVPAMPSAALDNGMCPLSNHS